MFSVYLIRNGVTGKIYIGQTRHSLQSRFDTHVADAAQGSITPLHRSIRKYGKDQFSIELLASATTYEELNVLEIQFIAKYNATDRNIGYNIQAGGETKGEAFRKYLSEFFKGRQFSKETRRLQSIGIKAAIQRRKELGLPRFSVSRKGIGGGGHRRPKGLPPTEAMLAHCAKMRELKRVRSLNGKHSTLSGEDPQSK